MDLYFFTLNIFYIFFLKKMKHFYTITNTHIRTTNNKKHRVPMNVVLIFLIFPLYHLIWGPIFFCTKASLPLNVSRRRKSEEYFSRKKKVEYYFLSRCFYDVLFLYVNNVVSPFLRYFNLLFFSADIIQGVN